MNTWSLLAAWLLATLALPAFGQPQTLVLGVHSYRTADTTQQRLEPVVDLLRSKLPELSIELRVFDGDAMDQAIARNQLDLVLTNPSHYLQLRSRNGLSGVLATLVRREGRDATASMGGVIVARNDAAIRNLIDLRHRRIGIVGRQGVGGFQAQAFELRQAGITLPDDATLQPFNNQPAVLEALLKGEVDVGFVRTGLLEELASDGRLDLNRVKVVNPQRLTGFPYRLSTRLYPEWPVVALPHVDSRVVRRVASALLALDPDHPAMVGAGIAGFDPPADYLPVEQLARQLRMAPYDQPPTLRLRDLWDGNRVALSLGAVALLAIVSLLLLLAHRNRQLTAGNQELARSRRLLQTVIDTAPVGVFWKDRELRFLGANRSFAADNGLSQGTEVIGKTDFDLAEPGDAERFRQADQQVLDSGQATLRYEQALTSRDGHQTWLRASKVPLRDEAGTIIGVLGIYEDVTEQRRQQQALLAAHHQLQATLEAIPDLLFEIDLEGRYHGAHSPRQELLVASGIDLIGHTVQELLPPDAAQVCHDALRDALRDGHCSGYQYALDLPGGRRWFEVSVARKAGHEPGPPRFILLARDITERKAVEAELERHRTQLEDLVAARTAELNTAKEAAESASRSKSAFLANMSHEIRTPLNAVIGLGHVLRRSQLTPQQRRWLESLSGAGEHLLQVLNAILDLSKIEAGKFTLEESPVDLRSLLSNVFAMMADRAAAKSLRLLREVPADLPLLLGDPTRLQQAMLNYLHNAIKFTAQGQVTLRLRLDDRPDQRVQLLVEVEDTGIGIDAQTLPRLFGAFEQADNSPARSFGGTGLGLAITQRLAQMMGGEAGARSEPGHGSTFWFTAALKRAPVPARRAAPAGMGTPVDAEQQLREQHAGRRVLLAEDDPINREVAIELLEIAGLRVVTAVDGEQAVSLARDGEFDLLLMDVQMPRLDGLQATRRIRALPGAKRLPIIALTANAFADDRARCLEAGMDDFIAKPLDTAELYAVLLRWMPSQVLAPW